MDIVARAAKGIFVSGLMLGLAACVQAPLRPTHAALPAGARYVAMGSSYASGLGITLPADEVHRCGRSVDSYPRQLARALKLELTDASCASAKTSHVLGAWDELAAQIDSVTADTRLVTVTIGGNDVGYIGGLFSVSCAAAKPEGPCPQVPPASEQAWITVEASMHQIAAEVRRRAPAARLVFVDYPTILPERGACAETPMRPDQADAFRELARRLAGVTARVAKEANADLLEASRLSRAHSACASVAWMNGFPRSGGPQFAVAYHPNLASATAVARALERLLER